MPSAFEEMQNLLEFGTQLANNLLALSAVLFGALSG
jgi:hypothetical protein